MEGWGNLRYILPALGGGLGVYLLVAEANKAPNNNSCYFGFGVLSILISGAIMFSLISVSLFTNNPPNDGLNDEVWLKPFFIIASIIFLGYSFDCWKRKIFWSEKGLIIQRFLRPELFIQWKDIEKLRYSNWAQWWKITSQNGQKVIFYDMMRGSKHLITEISKKATNQRATP